MFAVSSVGVRDAKECHSVPRHNTHTRKLNTLRTQRESALHEGAPPTSSQHHHTSLPQKLSTMTESTKSKRPAYYKVCEPPTLKTIMGKDFFFPALVEPYLNYESLLFRSINKDFAKLSRDQAQKKRQSDEQTMSKTTFNTRVSEVFERMETFIWAKQNGVYESNVNLVHAAIDNGNIPILALLRQDGVESSVPYFFSESLADGLYSKPIEKKRLDAAVWAERDALSLIDIS